MNEARILVVDDEADLTRMLRIYLQQIGHFQVRVENRSTDAVAAALEFRPDLVLLDVIMPDMDGSEVAQILKTQPELGDVIILFYSALEITGENPTPGGHRFLAKPVNPGALVTAVKLLLCERTARHAAVDSPESRVDRELFTIFSHPAAPNLSVSDRWLA